MRTMAKPTGNPNGRPPKFKTPEELAEKIENYFNSITKTKLAFEHVKKGIDVNGDPIYENIPVMNNNNEQVTYTEFFVHPTMSGLCLDLKCSVDTLNEYSKKEGFSEPIKMAKKRIEKYLEEKLYREKQVTGIIFNLKNNYGWKDKVEHDVSGEVNHNHNLKLFMEEE